MPTPELRDRRAAIAEIRAAIDVDTVIQIVSDEPRGVRASAAGARIHGGATTEDLRRMAGLREIARALGLSATTVSRALDGYDDVAPLTRARVRAAAREFDYAPNAAARRLRRGASEIVTLVLPVGRGQINEPLYLELMGPIGARLARDNYDLTVMAASPGAEEMRTYRRLVEGRRADALIVVRTRREDERLRYLLDKRFPFVAMGRAPLAEPFASVDGDGEAGFADATRRLAAIGHRHIAHVAGPSALVFAETRRAGYEGAMARLGLEPRVAEGIADEDGGFRAAASLLAARRKPTALLCATDRMAIGAYRALREAGLGPGRDCAVVGHDNIAPGGYVDPPLATMELAVARTGTRLAEMALALIGGARPQDLRDVQPVRFIERRSFCPPPG